MRTVTDTDKRLFPTHYLPHFPLVLLNMEPARGNTYLPWGFFAAVDGHGAQLWPQTCLEFCLGHFWAIICFSEGMGWLVQPFALLLL